MSKNAEMAVPTKKQAESSVIQIGACKFCGQTYQLETSGMCSEGQLNEWATEKCDCWEAEEERELTAAEEKAAIHSVSICAVDSVVVNVGNGVKTTLKLNKGKVQVKKTITEENTLEG